jgi:hypothetical protein
MPCKKYIQVVGTQESRTFHSNQLVNEVNEKMSQEQQSFREEPFYMVRKK